MANLCGNCGLVAPAADGLVPVEDALRDAIVEAKRQAAAACETYTVLWCGGLFSVIEYDIDAPDGTFLCDVGPNGSLEFYDLNASFRLPARVHPTGTGR